jgi:pyrophosphatase PpaX
MIKAFIFDFDGPVVKTLPVHYEAFNRIAAHFGCATYGSEEEHALKWVSWKKRFKELGITSPDDEAKALQIYRDTYKELESRIEFLPETRTLFQRIKESDMLIGIASNNQKPVIEHYLEKYGLSSYVDAIVSSEDVETLKPDPEQIVACRKKLGVEPEQSVYVGDMGVDIEAGRRDGDRTVAVTFGWWPENQLDGLGADMLAGNPLAVLDILAVQ